MNIIKDESVKKQIRTNFIIVLILDLIFYFLLCFFYKHNLSVILGIIIGSGYSVLNFIFIAISMEKLVFVSPEKVKYKAVLHYIIRYILMGIVIVFVMKSDNIINLFSFLVSIFFSKISIYIQVFLE